MNDPTEQECNELDNQPTNIPSLAPHTCTHKHTIDAHCSARAHNSLFTLCVCRHEPSNISFHKNGRHSSGRPCLSSETWMTIMTMNNCCEAPNILHLKLYTRIFVYSTAMATSHQRVLEQSVADKLKQVYSDSQLRPRPLTKSCSWEQV